jgi:hypothetical protein
LLYSDFSWFFLRPFKMLDKVELSPLLLLVSLSFDITSWRSWFSDSEAKLLSSLWFRSFDFCSSFVFAGQRSWILFCEAKLLSSLQSCSLIFYFLVKLDLFLWCEENVFAFLFSCNQILLQSFRVFYTPKFGAAFCSKVWIPNSSLLVLFFNFCNLFKETFLRMDWLTKNLQKSSSRSGWVVTTSATQFWPCGKNYFLRCVVHAYENTIWRQYFPWITYRIG